MDGEDPSAPTVSDVTAQEQADEAARQAAEEAAKKAQEEAAKKAAGEAQKKARKKQPPKRLSKKLNPQYGIIFRQKRRLRKRRLFLFLWQRFLSLCFIRFPDLQHDSEPVQQLKNRLQTDG